MTQPVVAPWRLRAAALAVDVLPAAAAVAALAPVALAADRGGWIWWVCVLAAAALILATAVNRLLLPATVGWSAGRALVGIAVVRPDGAADGVGPWRLLLREFAHLLDTAALGVGWLWPLWDRRGRTFADLLARTEVHRRAPVPAGAGRRVAALVATATAVAVAAALLGYVGVYRHDLRLAQTREQLAVSGPKIVEDVLSYHPKTLQDDFGRAQGLVTDNYRPQLVAQQDAVRKGTPVSNEYWVTNSAVLNATADTAAMLLLMQGQRGDGPNPRSITATVRVNFDRGGDGQWRVDNLTVLAKPKQNGAGG